MERTEHGNPGHPVLSRERRKQSVKEQAKKADGMGSGSRTWSSLVRLCPVSSRIPLRSRVRWLCEGHMTLGAGGVK